MNKEHYVIFSFSGARILVRYTCKEAFLPASTIQYCLDHWVENSSYEYDADYEYIIGAIMNDFDGVRYEIINAPEVKSEE